MHAEHRHHDIADRDGKAPVHFFTLRHIADTILVLTQGLSVDGDAAIFDRDGSRRAP